MNEKKLIVNHKDMIEILGKRISKMKLILTFFLFLFAYSVIGSIALWDFLLFFIYLIILGWFGACVMIGNTILYLLQLLVSWKRNRREKKKILVIHNDVIELFGKKISLMLVYVCHFGLLVFSIVSSIMNCNWNWFLLYVIIMGYIITCIMVGIFVMDVYHKCLSWRMKKREGKEAITERSMVGESHEN